MESNELVPVDEKASSQALVFGTLDPEGVISKATLIANSLAPIVERAKLYSMIATKQGPKKYVKVEGWATMLAMLGIFPATEYSRLLDRPNEIAYESRVILRHISGVIVGAGEGICSSKESNWSGRDEFTIKSMSQTRAEGKAARLAFSWIISLAGYEPTPAEEMPMEPIDSYKPAEPVTPRVHSTTAKISEPQRKRLYAIWKTAGKSDEDVHSYLVEHYGIEHTKDITKDIYEEICAWAGQGLNLKRAG